MAIALTTLSYIGLSAFIDAAVAEIASTGNGTRTTFSAVEIP